jgi:N-methylhydantoinase B
MSALDHIDDNLALAGDGTVQCRHCGAVTGSGRRAPLDRAATRIGPPSLAGPQVRDNAELFIDREVVFRQLCCPGCMTALLTEVVPGDEPSARGKRL